MDEYNDHENDDVMEEMASDLETWLIGERLKQELAPYFQPVTSMVQ